MNIVIIIPAYNEEQRIEKTLRAYTQFFNKKQAHNKLRYCLLVVLNGCVDGTEKVVARCAQNEPSIMMIKSPSAGKGLALRYGFMEALSMDADLIGFVDADMATQPQYFYDLIEQIDDNDVIVASRYMPGSDITPKRPWFKELGRTAIYNPLVRSLFGINLYDYQCGAKLFTKKAIGIIAPQLTVNQWACDIEMLYLAHRAGLTIKEIPTTWFDQDGSKFHSLGSGVRMIKTLIELRMQHTRDTK